MKPLHRKLSRDFRNLRGQVIAIGLVMVGGLGTMVMAQTNYAALSSTRVAISAIATGSFSRKISGTPGRSQVFA